MTVTVTAQGLGEGSPSNRTCASIHLLKLRFDAQQGSRSCSSEGAGPAVTTHPLRCWRTTWEREDLRSADNGVLL